VVQEEGLPKGIGAMNKFASEDQKKGYGNVQKARKRGTLAKDCGRSRRSSDEIAEGGSVVHGEEKAAELFKGKR